MRGHYSAAPGEILAAPQLARASSAPCEDGVPARIASLRSDKDTLTALFRRDAIDEHGLLSKEPTMLDVIVVRGLKGGQDCLRVPLVVDPTRPEWSETPSASFGYAFSLFAPFRRIYAADAAPMLNLRGGPFVGPVRLRAELGVGGAFEKNRNANLVAYSYHAGLLVDSLLLHAERFGLGVGAGYDLTGLTLSANVDALSHDGAGYQGLICGYPCRHRLGALAANTYRTSVPGPARRRIRHARAVPCRRFQPRSRKPNASVLAGVGNGCGSLSSSARARPENRLARVKETRFAGNHRKSERVCPNFGDQNVPASRSQCQAITDRPALEAIRVSEFRWRDVCIRTAPVGTTWRVPCFEQSAAYRSLPSYRSPRPAWEAAASILRRAPTRRARTQKSPGRLTSAL